jgi:plasmid stabilization system protein ParE
MSSSQQTYEAMPDAWSDKDERQYEHIKESARDSGKSNKRAKEIAARTVNRQRREEGRTPNRSTQGTGNPNSRLEDRTVEQLRNRASELDIKGRSKMNKRQLVSAIRSNA